MNKQREVKWQTEFEKATGIQDVRNESKEENYREKDMRGDHSRQ